jgi:hypothetical protein
MHSQMLLPDDPAVTNRRARLREWIDTRFGGSMTLFIASTNNGERQMNQGELSALLRNKTFGERRARSLEAMAHMPPRYLDTPAQAGPSAQLAPAVAEEQKGGYTQSKRNTPEHTAAPMGWPFSRVSLARIVALKKQLGPRTGTIAMDDIDELLDLVVSKWERRAASSAKSAA